MSSFPEHDKLDGIRDKTQFMGEFLSWLTSERGYVLCESYQNPEDNYVRYLPAHYNLTELLAGFFEIDLNKLEEEKLQILAKMRKLQKALGVQDE